MSASYTRYLEKHLDCVLFPLLSVNLKKVLQWPGAHPTKLSPLIHNMYRPNRRKSTVLVGTPGRYHPGYGPVTLCVSKSKKVWIVIMIGDCNIIGIILLSVKKEFSKC